VSLLHLDEIRKQRENALGPTGGHVDEFNSGAIAAL
jgi:hypothetical protein